MLSGLEEEYYTVPEAARLLKVSPSTVWRWIENGRLSAYRVGERRIRIRREDLASLIRPAKEGGKMAKKEKDIQVFKMSPTEAEDQLGVIAQARALQEEILKRRQGRLLPPSWQDLNEAREERSGQR